MSIDTPEKDRFLQELFRTSGGNSDTQISMYQIGDSLGFSKSEVSALSEDLIIDGLVELRTLSGAVSITPEGLAALGITAETDTASALPRLSGEKVLTGDDRQLLVDLINKTKQCTFGNDTELSALEELLIDLKTIEVQLLSDRPKTAIIRAVLLSMLDGLRLLEATGSTASLSAELENLASKS